MTIRFNFATVFRNSIVFAIMAMALPAYAAPYIDSTKMQAIQRLRSADESVMGPFVGSENYAWAVSFDTVESDWTVWLIQTDGINQYVLVDADNQLEIMLKALKSAAGEDWSRCERSMTPQECINELIDYVFADSDRSLKLSALLLLWGGALNVIAAQNCQFTGEIPEDYRGIECVESYVDEDSDGVIDYVQPKRNSLNERYYIYLNADGAVRESKLSLFDSEEREIERRINRAANGLLDNYNDEVVYYDPTRENETALCVSRVVYDENNDGKIDYTEYYANCKKERAEYDQNNNGVVEEIVRFDDSGNIRDDGFRIGADSQMAGHKAFEEQRFADAIGHYERAVSELETEWGRADGKLCSPLTELGHAYMLNGDQTRARARLKTVVQNAECRAFEHPRAYLLLAQMSNNERNFPEALQFIDQARSAQLGQWEQPDVDLELWGGIIRFQLKKFAECAQIFDALSDADLSDQGRFYKYSLFGGCQIGLGNESAGMISINTSIQAANAAGILADAQYMLASIFAVLSRTESALTYLRKALEANRDAFYSRVLEDHDFDSIRMQPGFKQLISEFE